MEYNKDSASCCLRSGLASETCYLCIKAGYVSLQMLNIHLIGDSHLHWLHATGVSVQANITWHTMRGGKLPFLLEAIELIEWERSVDVVVVMLGGNDLDQENLDVKALSNAYTFAFERLARSCQSLIYMAAWPRPGSRIGLNYWTNVGIFEWLLARNSRVWMWKWDRSLTFTRQFYARDGIHCARIRYKKVSRYLTAAILAGVKQIKRFDERWSRRTA